MSFNVHRHDFRDRRRDEQELFELEAIFRGESFRGYFSTFGGASHRALDFLNKPLDLERRSRSNLLLELSEVFAAFLVTEIDLYQSAGDKPATNENDGDEEVMAHQPPAPRPSKILDFRF